MKYTIVQFRNGKYGVRSGRFRYEFYSRRANNSYRDAGNVAEFCEMTKEDALEVYRILTDVGTPIKEE